MKDYSNTDMTDKVHCTPPAGGLGGTLNIHTYNQQLPIKDKKERLQMQILIEKKASLNGGYSFQHSMPVPVYRRV